MSFRSALVPKLGMLVAVLALPGSPLCVAAASDPPSPSAYERIYFKSCAVCHGEKGDGRSRAQTGLNPPPRDFTTPQAAEELSRERMIVGVTYGRPGSAMVGWEHRLSEEEIAGVVDFIQQRFMSPASAPAPTDAGKVAAAITAGETIFRENCATCHGDRGTGANWTRASLNPPPRDFTAPAARAELSLERMLFSVTHGRPGTAMMAFGTRLVEEEVRAVVGYIRTEFMGLAPDGERPPIPAARPDRAATAAPVADMSLPFDDGLVGDPEKGGQFYMMNCHVCHGRDGDGKGERAGFIRPAPRNFLSADSRRTLNRPALHEAISSGKRGTVMAAWKTVLNEQEIADVAEFVFQAFVHPEGASASPMAAKKKPVN